MCLDGGYDFAKSNAAIWNRTIEFALTRDASREHNRGLASPSGSGGAGGESRLLPPVANDLARASGITTEFRPFADTFVRRARPQPRPGMYPLAWRPRCRRRGPLRPLEMLNQPLHYEKTGTQSWARFSLGTKSKAHRSYIAPNSTLLKSGLRSKKYTRKLRDSDPDRDERVPSVFGETR